MRHRKKGRKLNRNTNQRRALFKALLRSLILYQKIETTETKAKAVQGLFDKLMTKAKKGSLAHRRQVLAFLSDKKAVHRLFDQLAPQTKKRLSGFTRLVRLGRRRGDNTLMARLELIDQLAPESESAKSGAAGSKSKLKADQSTKTTKSKTKKQK